MSVTDFYHVLLKNYQHIKKVFLVIKKKKKKVIPA